MGKIGAVWPSQTIGSAAEPRGSAAEPMGSAGHSAEPMGSAGCPPAPFLPYFELFTDFNLVSRMFGLVYPRECMLGPQRRAQVPDNRPHLGFSLAKMTKMPLKA